MTTITLTVTQVPAKEIPYWQVQNGRKLVAKITNGMSGWMVLQNGCAYYCDSLNGAVAHICSSYENKLNCFDDVAHVVAIFK